MYTVVVLVGDGVNTCTDKPCEESLLLILLHCFTICIFS